jgi:tetratricopeptide (TPR) repeat protein
MKSIIISLLLLWFTWPALADGGNHHEDLTPAQVGTVHFPTSCAGSVQKTFQRGVALLHSFWYEEAEKDFQQAATDDPRCAMAHWGIAMSLWHQLWNRPDDATIQRGLAEVEKAEALHPKTARERDYIAAIGAFYRDTAKLDHQARATAYSNGMEKIYRGYPDDKEAAVFYALSLLASEPEHDSSLANRKKAAAILEPLFTSEPDHPGVAHYLIHTYDTPKMAELGLKAARRYAKVAPAAPHALHMPSHIFARLGLWQDDINSNLASIAATRKTAAMHMGGEGHQFHAMDFLVYAYLQSGREADAKKVIDELKAMPATTDMYGMGFDPVAGALATFEASYALELHHWTDAAALSPVKGAPTGDNAITYWARSIGAAHLGDLQGARKDIEQIEAIHKQLLAQKKTDFAKAVGRDRKQAAAWLANAEHRNDEALKLLRESAEKDDGVSDASDQIPAREMLADMLFELKRPQEALTEYEADLKLNPNRFNALYGAARAAEAAGKTQEADSYYATLVKMCAGSNSDRPELARAKSLVAEK